MKHFLVSHDIDIACLTETHLISSKSFTVQGYKCYRRDRPGDVPAGGVLILVKSGIPHWTSSLPITPGLETIAVTINLQNGNNVMIISAYKPPNKQLTATRLQDIFKLKAPIILFGDLNTKHTSWGCRINQPAGTFLLNLAKHSNFKIIAPVDPTYFPFNANYLPDILDIVLTNLNFALHSYSICELDSDHNPVITTSKLITSLPNSPPHLSTHKINWHTFQNRLSSLLPPFSNLKTPAEIDQGTLLFTNAITNSIDYSSHSLTATRRGLTKYPLPEQLRNLISQKNKIRRLWAKHRLPHLKSALNHLTKLVRNALTMYQMESYKKYVSNLNPQDSSLWKATRRLLGQSTNIPPLKGNNKIAQSISEKAELLADYFETTFTQHAVNDRGHCTITHFVQSPNLDVPNRISFISPNEIFELIKKLPNKKSPGHDRITANILKNLPRHGLAYLNNIFNSALRLGYYPNSWKHSLIIPIPKPQKNLNLPSNYRPISLIPILSKIFEKLVLKRLKNSFLILTCFLLSNLASEKATQQLISY